MPTYQGIHTVKHPALPIPFYGTKDFIVPVPPGVQLKDQERYAHLHVTVVNPEGFGAWCSVLSIEPDSFTVRYHRPKYVEVPGCNPTMAPEGELKIHWTIYTGPVIESE